MNRCVIFGGAAIADYDHLRTYLREDDFNIFCDSGLRHMEATGLRADLVIGDFDSHPNPHLDTQTIVLPTAKDDTDTVYAVKEALRRGFEQFLLTGITGRRMDHTLANLSILLMLDSLHKEALAVDDYSEMEILSPGKEGRIGCEWPFFSLVAFGGDAGKITIRDAKFPLENASLTCEDPYGISNEPLPGRTACVTVNSGRLLLLRIRQG